MAFETREPEEVKQELEILFLSGKPAPLHEVAAYLLFNHIEHSDLVDGVVYASMPKPQTDPIVLEKVLIQFRFDSNNRLIDISTRLGLTGP